MIKTNGLIELFEKIDKNKEILNLNRPLDQSELKELQQYFKLSLTYSSNALEGNTLTLSETKVAIEDGLTVGGKPVRDYYEATGHAAAFDLMYEIAFGEGRAVTEENICSLHKLFYSGIDSDAAGKYRQRQNYISGTEYIPPAPENISTLMNDLVRWAAESKDTYHPVEFAAIIHRKLVDIHPFIDGNGRTARLLMNLCLLKDGYSIISIPPIMRNEYVQALQIAQRTNQPTDGPFIKLIAEGELESQRDLFRLLRISLPQKEKELFM